MKLFKKDDALYAFIEGCGIRLLLSHYKNGNYDVYIFSDGTKVRETEEDEFIPAFSENTDVCLTKKCSQGCVFCYENCTKDGLHGKVDYKFIDTLHAGTELAINGNDMDHPQLDEFLHRLHDKGVITNVTVSKNQFIANRDKIMQYQRDGLLHGIGISANSFDEDFIKMIEETPNSVVHTIAGICTLDNYKTLFGRRVKVLILGYKTRGRGVEYKAKLSDEIQKNIDDVNSALGEIAKNVRVLSFDNLAIEQLPAVRDVVGGNWDTFYMGDDGNYTFYIDLVAGTFAKNSCIDERFPIGDKSMDEMFNFIRERYK